MPIEHAILQQLFSMHRASLMLTQPSFALVWLSYANKPIFREQISMSLQEAFFVIPANINQKGIKNELSHR